MGTRNLTMVIKDGQTKIAQYGQWDGYPGGVGVDILSFLRDVNMEKFKAQLDKCTFFTDDMDESMLSLKYNSRDLGGTILDAVYHSQDANVLLVNNEEFIVDGLFCEWAYVVDLDANVLQVYEGFKECKLTEEDRFYYLQERVEEKQKKEMEAGENPYVRKTPYSCKIAAEFDLNNLPTDDNFIKAFSTEK